MKSKENHPLYQEVVECYNRISPHIHRTATLTSRLIDEEVVGQVVFKCENFQRGGSYKLRGALNACLQLNESERKNGVVTHSSGNFAQAVSLAAQSIGMPAYIVMPSSAPSVKVAGVKTYEGKITMCEPTLEAREATAGKIESDEQATFLHPSNQHEVIIGQGTAAYELLEDHPDLDVIFCPVGGGGLIAGTCIAAQGKCAVYGGEPYAVDDAYRSLQSGKIETNESTDTIADGLRTQLGNVNFPIIKNYVSEIVRVTEDEIIQAMRLVWERMKIIIEPSSATTVAAVIASKEKWQGKKVGIIISGGNVDLSNLPF